MPVIGRLDDQTNAILITPVEKRSRRSSDAQGEPTPGDAAEAPHTGRRTPDEERSSRDEHARRAELPVWLL